MSLILDALRQSKQQVGPVTQHDAPATVPGAQTAQRPFVVLALLAGTTFGAGAVAVWQWGAPQMELSTPPTAEPLPGTQRSSAAELSVATESFDTSASSTRPLGAAMESGQRLRAEPQPKRDVSAGVTEQVASLHQQMWSDAAAAGEAT
ncbi:MAG: hypothetical protein VW103_10025, partial [Halieaceae bacterium]